MGRRDFWIGFVGFCLFVGLMNFILDKIGTTMAGFFLFLVYLVLIFQILYAVYGKRLHDIGRSFWPLTAMITSIFVILIVVMLTFGGAEYMTEFAQYNRKQDIDPAVRQKIIEEYQENMKPSERIASLIIFASWAVFTLWLFRRR